MRVETVLMMGKLRNDQTPVERLFRNGRTSTLTHVGKWPKLTVKLLDQMRICGVLKMKKSILQATRQTNRLRIVTDSILRLRYSCLLRLLHGLTQWQ